jgi:hypothetical protein
MSYIRICGSQLWLRKDYERRLLGVATDLAAHWTELDLDEELSIEQVMSMDLHGLFQQLGLDLDTMSYIRIYGNLPEEYNLFLAIIAPLFRSGSVVTGERDNEMYGQWRFSRSMVTFHPVLTVKFQRRGIPVPVPDITTR